MIANTFVSNVKSNIPAIGVGEIYNADKSGSNFEVHSGRTLAKSGKQLKERFNRYLLQYILMSIISADGLLHSPFYIILKEPTGTFGLNLLTTLFCPVNIYIQASKSEKFTSKHFKTWFSKIYLPNTGHKSMLLIRGRSYSSQSEQLISQDKEAFQSFQRRQRILFSP